MLQFTERCSRSWEAGSQEGSAIIWAFSHSAQKEQKEQSSGGADADILCKTLFPSRMKIDVFNIDQGTASFTWSETLIKHVQETIIGQATRLLKQSRKHHSFLNEILTMIE